MNFSNRITKMQFSPIRKLAPFAEAAKASGKKVYHLNIGQPDIETPKEFFEAIKNFDGKVVEYALSQGIPQLIDMFIKYYKTFDIHFEKDEVLVTNGGSEAALFSLLAICDHGDEIIVPEPFYTNFNTIAQEVGVKLIPVLTKAENNFKLPPKSDIQQKITKKTKAFLFSNPNNPTGAVFSKEEVDTIKELAIENDLFIISDEVYREFVYDGLKHLSFAKVPEISDRVILIDSVSKRYSACGTRVGCIASKNKQLIEQIMKLCQGRLSVATIEQIGVSSFANVSTEYSKKVFEEYSKRRDIVYNALSQMEGVICNKPCGAFYVIAKLPIDDAEKFAKFLLTEFSINNETVMVSPAGGFYVTEGLGTNEVRISYVLKEENLYVAMNIIKEGLIQYRNMVTSKGECLWIK